MFIARLKSRLPVLLLPLLLALTALPAGAGGTEDFGEYRVHYNALSTDHLSPVVASAYDVVRSRNRALLNIAVTREEDGTTGIPVSAIVNVNAANLSGQVKNVNLRKVTEPAAGEDGMDAIYYIAEINVSDGEVLIFDVKVTPEGHEQTYSLRFKQQFFAN